MQTRVSHSQVNMRAKSMDAPVLTNSQVSSTSWCSQLKAHTSYTWCWQKIVKFQPDRASDSQSTHHEILINSFVKYLIAKPSINVNISFDHQIPNAYVYAPLFQYIYSASRSSISRHCNHPTSVNRNFSMHIWLSDVPLHTIKEWWGFS